MARRKGHSSSFGDVVSICNAGEVAIAVNVPDYDCILFLAMRRCIGDAHRNRPAGVIPVDPLSVNGK